MKNMKMYFRCHTFVTMLLLSPAIMLASANNTIQRFKMIKTNQPATFQSADERLAGVHYGNKLKSVFYNYGSIGRPNTEPSFEWPSGSRHGYAYEFGLIIGAEVEDSEGNALHIFSEALIDGGDRSPGGKVWGWQPLAGYAAAYPNENIAMSNDPNTWPDNWSEWPGIQGQGTVSADLESYWVMDDRDNSEFDYYPCPSDSSIRGLGLEVSCRGYQWGNALDEDFILFTYQIKNVSEKTLTKVVAGVFGDPHIGGPGDFSDDWLQFITKNGMDSRTGKLRKVSNVVYCYDHIDSENDFAIPWNELGWFGIQFLQTPEAGSGDELGLTNAAAPIYGTANGSPSMDENMWQMYTPGNFSTFSQNADNVVLAGSGYFSLQPGDSATLAVAYLLGRSEEDLLWNAENAWIAYSNLCTEELPSVNILSPLKDDVISETANLQWTTDYSGNIQTIDIYYNNGKNTGWKELAVDLADNGSYQWNTSELEDGYNYRIALIAHATDIAGRNISDYFVINSPTKSAEPEILLQYPVNENSLSGKVNIRWRAGDADGDAVSLINIYFSQDKGNSWQLLKENAGNTGSYLWDTGKLPNGKYYSLKLSVPSGGGEIFSEPSEVFSISNDYESISDSTLVHVYGGGDGLFEVNVVEPGATTGHYYQVTFDDTSAEQTTYDVFDLDTKAFVLENVTQLNDNYAGPLFDGLRLTVDDLKRVSLDEKNSRWISGNPNVNMQISTLNPDNCLPVNYELRFFADYVDTSLIVNPQPIKFEAWNTTDSLQSDVAFFDQDGNGEVSIGDFIYPLYYVNGDSKTSWKFEFANPDSGETVLPKAGDIYLLATKKPFSCRDVFEFKSPEPITYIDQPGSGKYPQDFHVSQNYPNPFNGATRIRYRINRPCRVQLIIYDVTGREVVRLVDRFRPAGEHFQTWDGHNSAKQEVASGLYFYKFKAGDYISVKKCLFLK